MQVSSENIATIYKEDGTSFYDKANIFHINDSLSEIQIKLNYNNFLFLPDEETNTLLANIRINVFIFNNLNDKIAADSSSMNISTAKNSNKTQPHIIPLKINKSDKKAAFITILDLNNNAEEAIIIDIDKKNGYSKQWFLPIENIKIVENSFICHPDSLVKFKYLGDNKQDLKCYWFGTAFPIPKPPFILNNNTENKSLQFDSIFPIKYDTDSEILYFKSKKYGIYFISADTSLNEGFSILCTERGYPDILYHNSMIGPIRYISTQKEFNDIHTSSEKARAIENFWLKIGTNEEHARNLIKKYYSRVKKANTYFTSYIQGWQTDRGMIYIVFGAPNYVYRSDNDETWIYGEEGNIFSTKFYFLKNKNKFSNNDFILQRTPIHKDIWFRAVEIWRQ